jgi:hypothetical protein
VEWAWVAGESAPEPRRITDRQRNKEHELEKRPTERYRKSRMAKNGNGNLKKNKKKKQDLMHFRIFFSSSNTVFNPLQTKTADVGHFVFIQFLWFLSLCNPKTTSELLICCVVLPPTSLLTL